jgi:hypothetical protein
LVQRFARQTVNAGAPAGVIVGEKKLPRNFVTWCFANRTEAVEKDFEVKPRQPPDARPDADPDSLSAHGL